ncbi:MAG: hypothetical protein GC181_12625 [Bacteroidetes bacterium]|nr:hypothetical protein [Bacteroidota bacterium]
MYRNTFYPLRKIVSTLVPIQQLQPKPPLGAKLIYRSETAETLNYSDLPSHMTSLASIINRNVYNEFLPSYGNTITPGTGMGTLPLPNNFSPFTDNNSFLSIYGKTDPTNDLSVSRKLSVKYLISIDNDAFFKQYGRKPLIGGICFKGFPYTHFALNENGENRTNFGLPREVRITCMNIPDNNYPETFTEFLDEEITSVQQQITSHSAFQYVCCDPTLATHILLEFSDFPSFSTNFKTGKNKKIQADHFFGMMIPYLFVFEYEEKTRYRNTVPSGFLGGSRNNYSPDSENIEWSFLNAGDDGALQYFDFTAASIFGQQRTYDLVDNGSMREFNFSDLHNILQNPPTPKRKKGKPRRYQECFISKTLKEGESILLHFEQGEEFERCLSGIRLLMPFIPEKDLQKDVKRLQQLTELFFPQQLEDLLSAIPNVSPDFLEEMTELLFHLPELVKFCTKTRIRIFELDPVDGISPVNVKPDDKYATLLADVTIDTLSELILSSTLDGIKFRKVSASKYFAIEFTNASKEAAQIVVKSLKFIQSAHVSVTSSSARIRQVKNMQFRIIGPGIADDYSRLGQEGFSFSVERQSAGKRGDVLFRANSLMDLLHSGVGKVFSNSRRRAVEFEKVESGNSIDNRMGEFKSNYEIRRNIQKSVGWRSSETGKNVNTGNNFDTDPDLRISPEKSFENYGNSEVRTHSENLFPESKRLGPWKFLEEYFGLIADLKNDKFIKVKDVLLSINNLLDKTSPADKLWLNKQFKGFNEKELKIKGVNTVSTSPFSQVKNINDLIEFGKKIKPNEYLDFGTTLAEVLLFNPYIFLTGGVNTSVSLSPGGIGVSLGSQPFPMFNNAASYGSSGNIAKSASDTRYSFGQFLSKSGDNAKSKSVIEESEFKRMISRSSVPDTDRQRITGAEVMWQDELVDIITGTIPLNFELPATASKMYFRTSDDTLRVRFGNGIGNSVTVDFWFEINEEIIKDDY